jgi:hypothetical protein
MDRASLSTGSQPGAHRGNQTVAQMAGAREKAVYDRLRHTVIGQQIAARSNVFGAGFTPDAETIPPGMNGRLTPLINREQLPIVDEPAPPLDFRDRGLGAHGALHEVESERTKRRVRHIL